MGRKRKKENSKLPPYVYLSQGRYIYRPYTDGKLKTPIRLCSEKSSLSEVWAAYEAMTEDFHGSLRWLLDAYCLSSEFLRLKPKTQREFLRQKEAICSFPTSTGKPFGDIALRSITPPTIRKFLDKRGQTAPVSANREAALISKAFSWGREYGKCTDNPCLGVRRNQEQPRQRYVTDDEYQLVYDLALKAQPWLSIAMEIAFLCRARLGEIINLQERHKLDEGLLIERSKKSKTQIILYGDRLNSALEASTNLPGVSWQRYLLHDSNGQRIKEYTFKSAWQRLMQRATKTGLKTRFTFHDLKAKGVSDFDGDKKLASGHRTDKMVDVYDRKPGTVNPTR
jgi:integrase